MVRTGKTFLKSTHEEEIASKPKKLRKKSQVDPLAGVKMARIGMKMTCKRYWGVNPLQEKHAKLSHL